MPLLQVENLTRSFGSTRALADATLSIERGEIVALMGANGAGKSTLVKILSGSLPADGGRISFKGKSFAPANPAEATKAGIVTVHQSTDLVGPPGLTVADALLLHRFADRRVPFFVSRAGTRARAQAVLDIAGFSLPLDRDFGDLPAADRQLVAVARALADQADLLILDEPTASLSGQESRRLFDILLRLKSRDWRSSISPIAQRIWTPSQIARSSCAADRSQGSFVRSIDFPAAIETMIGRKLQSARPGTRSVGGKPVFEMRHTRLLPNAIPFDLSLHEGEVVAITGVLGAGKKPAPFGDLRRYPTHRG